MKMIISAKRNPELSREQFFHHLRQVHWPLVRDCQPVRESLKAYVQNHAWGEDSSAMEAAAPFRLATERDSVIELYFDGDAGLRRLTEVPEYMDRIRPDEARFNDLASNVMTKTTETVVFTADRAGRCKRFDFIARAADVSSVRLRSAIEAEAERHCLDPLFTAQVDKLTLNWPREVEANGDGQGFGSGAVDCVRELWAGSVAGMAAGSVFGALDGLVDRKRSFSVLATEFVMIPLEKAN